MNYCSCPFPIDYHGSNAKCGRCFRTREPEPNYCWDCDGAGMVSNPGSKSGIARCRTCKGEGELPAGALPRQELAKEDR